MERRAFLRTAALSTLAAASISPLSLGQNNSPVKKIPISVQVYSVRNAAAKDLAGTLAKIAKLGYDGVEFAGYYNHDAKDIRKMLDDSGLKCSGTHTGIGQLRGDNFEKTAEIHKALGTKFMIVPGGIDNYLHDVEKSKEIAAEFNEIAKKARTFGLSVGYHAHGGDAKLIDGTPAWERLFDATNREVVMQMDIGNYKDGGGDPYKMIEKFRGRSKTVHLKESGQGHPIIGSGTVDWKRVFTLCETIGGTEWYVVEDEVTADNFDRIEKCIIALREMGK
jgi:sugar phosphate isomerase/epimerase